MLNSEPQVCPPERVAVLGLGYVGCVTAACLAELGHHVCGVDRDEHKVQSVLEHRAPFFEPGLEELIARNVSAGRLTAASETSLALRDAGIAVVCVGTPSERGGDASMAQLQRVCEQISVCRPPGGRLIVAVRSTVFPGTCGGMVKQALGDQAGLSIVSNPEFLREGCAVEDFLQPSLIVVGSRDEDARARVAALYAGLNVGPCLVTLETAEMIKFVCNAFHAVKISFANEVGALCGRLGIPAREVMATLCEDTRLNLSPAYLKPGFAFGGSCLPKDLRALNYRAVRMELTLPLLGNVLASNEAHLHRALSAVLDLGSRRLGVFGLAFKENTDDLRESPAVTLVEQLIGKGRSLRIFDPHIRLDRIRGANRAYVLSAIPHIGQLLQDDLGSLLGWAEHLLILQKPSAGEAAQVAASGLPALDLTGAESKGAHAC
ncbi:MAG TPA: nucleotide sugar dehydrogenase [Bryobacteraceae bacterium]|nr:nucleotide sugar dehydrogenase [Bryobacteraceae bacterium]